jgi:KDO2-lipid IV(A) lauroyltransferase
MRYRFKHVAEYAALRIAACVLNALPYRLALGAAWPLAWLAFHVARFRVPQARSRIRQVFGDRLGPGGEDRLAWLAWRGVVFTAVEALRLPRVTRRWTSAVSDHGEFIRVLSAHAATGRGAVIACPHAGSWELAAVTCCLAGMPIFTVAARQKNPLADAYLNRLRASPGIVSIARGSGAMKEALRRLRDGGMLAILPDVRAASGGLPIPFLGGAASIGRGMASFASHAGVPIFPCVVFREGWSRHRIAIHDPVLPDPNADREEDLRRMTVAVFRVFDDAIRQRPEQWFWFNKRWVLDPP